MTNKNQFTADKQPKGRGKAFKTLLMETIKKEALMGVSKNTGLPNVELAFIKHWATRAFDPDDTHSGALLKELAAKSYPSLKPVLETIEFSFDPSATPAEQASQVLAAAASGLISPDVAVIFISAIKSNIDIEMNTEIKARVEKIEELLLGDAR